MLWRDNESAGGTGVARDGRVRGLSVGDWVAALIGGVCGDARGESVVVPLG